MSRLRLILPPLLAAAMAWASFTLLATREDSDDRATVLAGGPVPEAESGLTARFWFAVQAGGGAALLQFALARRPRQR